MSIDSLTRAEKIRKHQEEMKLKNEQEAMNILLNKPADNIQQIEFFYDMDTPQSYKNSVDFVISKLNEKKFLSVFMLTNQHFCILILIIIKLKILSAIPLKSPTKY